MIIYLHGFQSSAASLKGVALKAFFQKIGRGDEIELPSLPPRPVHAQAWMQQRMRDKAAPVHGILGSSLGGCYAHWMASEYGLKTVLINPATGAGELMREYLGHNENPNTGERFLLTEKDMSALEQMDTAPIRNPDDILCLLQQGDDVLDASVAARRYRHCRVQMSEGGSHGFDEFEKVLPLVCSHFGMEPPA